MTSTLFLGSCVPPPSGDGGGGGSSPLATGSIGGQIQLPERIQLDSDTPEPANPQTSNNTLALAQVIPNLVMVAGNVGSTVDPADPDDYYTTSLNAGDTVKLTIGDTMADLDLYLYQGGGVVASSTGAGKSVESLNSPGAGSYQIRVKAVTGASTYQLKVGALNWASVGAAAPVGDFVPGEVLVRMKPPVGAAAVGDPRSVLRSRAENTAKRHNTQVGALNPHGVARLTFATGVAAGDVNARDEARHRTLAKIKELQADPDVEYAEPNFIVRPTAIPNDTYWNQQWNLDLINLPAAWDGTTGSPAVIVAVVDTGVLYNHPDLAANILKDGSHVVGYDMISSAASANDGNGIDPDPYDAGDEATRTQSSYHGTHVAGTIGAVSNNSQGIAGVAWNVRIMPVRVLGKSGDTYDVAEGIKYAAGVANVSGTVPMVGGSPVRADVISLSLGLASYSQTLQDAVNLARNAGVTVVAAAGNDANSSNFYPAACTGVIGVSAVDYAGELAPYSNFGSYVDLAAPGGDTSVDLDNNGYVDGILSTLAVGLKAPTSFNYVYYQGTSMAAPHISGVIALMKAYHNRFAAPGNQLTPEEIDSLIRGTAPGVDSITNYPRAFRENNLGYGLIDAEKAVMAAGILAGSTTGVGAHLELAQTEVDFGFTTTTISVGILNGGVDQLTGLSVSPYTAPWLSYAFSGSQLNLTVDRSSLAEGVYQTTITVNSDNGGSENLDVRVYKAIPVVSNLGQVYVLLIDARGNADMITTALAADYTYRFTVVKKGVYQIVAGTDLDNDGYIGDPGEFIGRYPSLGLPQQINLAAGQMLIDRDFTLEPVTTTTTAMHR